MRPTTEQARVLRTWMKAHRDTYNKALRLVKDRKARPNLTLKKLVVTARPEDNPQVQRMKETPANIRVRAVLDLIDVYKSSWEAFKKRRASAKPRQQPRRRRRRRQHEGSARHHRRRRRNARRRWKGPVKPPFEVSYKSRRLTSDSFGMEPKSVRVENGRLFLFRSLKIDGIVDGIRLAEDVRGDILQCCRVQYVFGRWYFLLPYKAPIDASPPTERIVALDPGVRTFQTFYHEDGAGEIGQDMGRLERQHTKIASIRDAMESASGPKRQRLRRAWYRHEARAKHIVADFHYKTIAFLFDNFDVVVAPRLSSHTMLQREFGLAKTTRSRMRMQCHSLFHQRLTMKASLRGKRAYDLREHGTSRTCSACGRANHGVGSSKTFTCVDASCGAVYDRDINASKNHLLKFLVGNNDYE